MPTNIHTISFCLAVGAVNSGTSEVVTPLAMLARPLYENNLIHSNYNVTCMLLDMTSEEYDYLTEASYYREREGGELAATQQDILVYIDMCLDAGRVVYLYPEDDAEYEA
jgi:hypothetical protein